MEDDWHIVARRGDVNGALGAHAQAARKRTSVPVRRHHSGGRAGGGGGGSGALAAGAAGAQASLAEE